MLKNLIISMRPKHWTKNLFVFAGLIFAGRLFYIQDILKVIYAFFLFCIASGGMYIINDIMDREKDRLHPVKRERPITSGALSISSAWFFSLFFIVIGLVISWFLSKSFFFTLVSYLVLIFLYSLFLKDIVLIDILTIAFGFVLRAAAGCLLIDVLLSPWLFMCTLLLALFLAASKRRQEIIFLDSKAEKHRVSLSGYSPELIDKIIVIVTACTVVAYMLYTLSPDTVEKFNGQGMVLTVPFVLYGIMRYFYLTHIQGKGENPELVLVEDKPLLINILLWILSSVLIIYRDKICIFL